MTTNSAYLQGVRGSAVRIEASLQRSLPKIVITGLPGDIVRESTDRIIGCLEGLGYEVPSSRLLIHLSPAGHRKQGSQFDLAVALAVLAAEKFIPADRLSSMAFLGELGLDGSLLPIVGAVALVEALAATAGVSVVVVPRANAVEVGLAPQANVLIAEDLSQVIRHLCAGEALAAVPREPLIDLRAPNPGRLDRVRGQPLAKRALQVAMAGRHHLLFAGEPGVGKSLLASLAPEIAAPLSRAEQREVFQTHSHLWKGQPPGPLARPFRSPHHSASASAVLGGGGGHAVPGEVTLAHRGVLFLDELPEFRRDVLEGLREPLESGEVHVTRVGSALSFPARFQLIAAMNPCPCGYAFSLHRRCACAPDRRLQYQRRISGPLLDRIDISVILRGEGETMPSTTTPATLGHALYHSLEIAWQAQKRRFGSDCAGSNSEIAHPLEAECMELSEGARTWLEDLLRRQVVSHRVVDKVARVGRTIADLSGSPLIEARHLAEAWALRCPDALGGDVRV